MDQTHSSNAARFGSRQRMTDVTVVIAMVLVAVAVSVALSLHFGLPTSRASVAGVLIFALLVGAHFFLVPRAANTEDVTELEDEELWRALKEQRQNAPDAKRMAMATRGEVIEPTPEVEQALEAAPFPEPNLSEPTSSEPTSLDLTEAPSAAHVPRRKPRILGQAPSMDQSSKANTAATDKGAPIPAHTDPSAEGSYWSYRPSSDAPETEGGAETIAHQEPFLNTPTSAAEPVAGQERHAEGRSRQPSESDVELVQSMIKKLAHQVNAREVLEQTTSPVEPVIEQDAVTDFGPITTGLEEQARAPAPSALLPPELPSQGEQEQASDAPELANAPQIIAQTPPPQSHPPSTPATVDLVTETVGALRTTAEAMREADDAAPDGAPQMDQPVRPAMRPEASNVAEAISAALAAGQVGVLLEPIVSLNGMRPDHYEVRLQISAAVGADLGDAGVEQELQATGVLADVDRERFIKTLSVGELLRERGKAGSLLTRIYRESLLDRDFCFAVATSGVANEELARHMVLTLTQDAVRTLTATEWQTLKEFHEMGYRFAISHVHDLDMDFAQLTAAGFTFVKLSADAFLGGALDGEGAITPIELSRYLAHSGLTVIVEGLEHSAHAAEALAMGVGLGQGPITGGPRLLKANAVASEDHAVA